MRATTATRAANEPRGAGPGCSLSARGRVGTALALLLVVLILGGCNSSDGEISDADPNVGPFDGMLGQDLPISKVEVLLIEGRRQESRAIEVLAGSTWRFEPDGRFHYSPGGIGELVRDDLYPLDGAYVVERSDRLRYTGEGIGGSYQLDSDVVIVFEAERSVQIGGTGTARARMSGFLAPDGTGLAVDEVGFFNVAVINDQEFSSSNETFTHLQLAWKVAG